MIVIFGLLIGVMYIGVMGVNYGDCPLEDAYYLERIVGEEWICSSGDVSTEGCYELNEEDACTEETCMYGYYWDDEFSHCKSCSVGMKECDPVTGDGISCFVGYTTSDCVSCGSLGFGDCLVCSEYTCVSCGVGSALYGGNCYSCDDVSMPGHSEFASTCATDGVNITVTECDPGSVMFTDGEHTICVSCSDDNYEGSDPSALECIESPTNPGKLQITECNARDSENYCLYHFGTLDYEYSCELQGVDYTIQECTLDDEDAWTAIECRVGYDLCALPSQSNWCFDCGNGGASGAVACTFEDGSDCVQVESVTCPDGYAFDEVDSCESCGIGCTDCVYETDHVECLSCLEVEPWEQGYYFYEHPVAGDITCNRCSWNCNECVDDEVCETCVSVIGNEDCYYFEDSGDDTDDEDEDEDDEDDDTDDTDDNNDGDDIDNDEAAFLNPFFYFL